MAVIVVVYRRMMAMMIRMMKIHRERERERVRDVITGKT